MTASRDEAKASGQWARLGVRSHPEQPVAAPIPFPSRPHVSAARYRNTARGRAAETCGQGAGLQASETVRETGLTRGAETVRGIKRVRGAEIARGAGVVRGVEAARGAGAVAAGESARGAEGVLGAETARGAKRVLGAEIARGAGAVAAGESARGAEAVPGAETIWGARAVGGAGAVGGGESAPGAEGVPGAGVTRGDEIVRSTEAVRDTGAARSAEAARGAGAVESARLPEQQPEAWRAYAAQLAEETQAADRTRAEDRRAEEAGRMLRRVLARSAKSVEEARCLLLDAGLSAQQAQRILDRFQEHGQLDDHELARQLIRRFRDRGGHGIAHLRRRLRGRGLATTVIESALAEHDDDAGHAEDESMRAARVAHQRAGRMRGLESDIALRRLTAFLQRRGYDPDIALTAAREALAEQLGKR